MKNHHKPCIFTTDFALDPNTNIAETRMFSIMVFGSNLAGRHGRGSARRAMQQYGAQYGIGVGPTGHAYAIPTKDEQLRVLPLDQIATYVQDFILYATAHPDLRFWCVAVGTGLAGYTDEQMAPLFKDVPPNVSLPDHWKEINTNP